MTAGRAEGYTPKTFPIEKAKAIYAELHAELQKDLPDLPAEFPLDEAGLRAVLDPAHIVRERAVDGGPQPAELQKLFVAVASELARNEAIVATLCDQLDAAQARLNTDFEALIAS